MIDDDALREARARITARADQLAAALEEGRSIALQERLIVAAAEYAGCLIAAGVPRAQVVGVVAGGVASGLLTIMEAAEADG